MLTATVVAFVLGLHGAEPAREVKFQGVLVAQADLPGTPPPPPLVTPNLVDTAATQKQIDALVADRPALTAPTVLLCVGGSLIGASLTAAILASTGGGWTAVAIILLAAAVGLLAIIPTVIGAVMMNNRVQARHSIDARVKMLRQSIAEVPAVAETIVATF
jgi:hypothetical protein